jgi:hypothetical protein
MNNIHNLIKPFLTDFSGNELLFEKVFEQNKSINSPINNILELGVHHGENPIFGGQSTKGFYYLYNTVGFNKLYSLDLASECDHTIFLIKQLFQEAGYKCPEHEFVVCNSIDYNPSIKFDFIFLDTNHDSTALPAYVGNSPFGGSGFTYLEIEKYIPMLSANGRFFLHDTKNFYGPVKLGNNVEGAIVKFIRDNPAWAFIEHDTNNCGMGELINMESDIFKFLKSIGIYKYWRNLSFHQINKKYE